MLNLKENIFVDDISVDELQKVTSPEDRQFSKFTSRIKRNPDQVLRYNRGGVPLWISTHHIPNEEDIPRCEYCGTQRQFEFQVSNKLVCPSFISKINFIVKILRNWDRPH